ncbi:hypothetical protein JCM5353_005694 [Sporobolomyces roseus]
MSQATTPHYSETSSIWVAALILPLVVLLSGLLIAFLCWRRLRSNNSSLKASNQLNSSPASSQDISDTSPSSKSNSVLQYPRPLFLSHSSPTLAHRIHRPHPIYYQSRSSFPSVSTTVNSQGSRVLIKKGRKSWPPEIGWPIPLEPFYPTNDQCSPVSRVEGGIGRQEERNEIETDLHRGISQVTGYHSNSHPQPQPHYPYHHSLVEEASNTRNSWHEGDDASFHFSGLPNCQRPPPLRTRSLSSRSLSEYSHYTVGATTLGKLLDEEIERVAHQQREQELQEQVFDPSTPLVPFVATNTIQPLKLPRHERPRSSADLYSLHPIQHCIPFPRLPPMSNSKDFPSTPSPPPQQDILTFDSPLVTSLPLDSDQNENGAQVRRERKESKNWDGGELVEWRNGKMEERRKEREEAIRKYNNEE